MFEFAFAQFWSKNQYFFMYLLKKRNVDVMLEQLLKAVEANVEIVWSMFGEIITELFKQIVKARVEEFRSKI